jgi:uncharacterized protein (TIGR02145 family)
MFSRRLFEDSLARSERGPVESNVSGKSIGIFIPDISAGTYPLAITINGVKQQFDIKVNNISAISNPTLYLDDYFVKTLQSTDRYRTYIDSLVSEGIMDATLATSNRAYWNAFRQKAQIEYAQLTPDQKSRLAMILESNKAWLSNLDMQLIGYSSFKNNTVEDCRALIKEGRDLLKGNPSFTDKLMAAKLSVEAYYCGLSEKVKHDFSDDIGKAAALFRNTENQFMHFTLINLLGEKIENNTKEIDQLGKSPSIAESIDKTGTYKVSNVIDFCNAQPVNFYLTVNYRTLNPNDINGSKPYADFAKMFDNLILTYDDYIVALNEPLLYRPGYGNKTRKLDINAFLSVPNASVSNHKVTLLNTQTTANNDWQVIFATDESSIQNFNFDVKYDDGNVQLSSKVTATVSNCNSTVTDVDGNVYPIVKIAGMYWIKENLKTTHFNNGDQIEELALDSLWEYTNLGEIPAWCYYNQNPTYNNDYGKLYNWYAVNDSRNLCPVGWHVSSRFEWMSMVDNLGGASIAGGKLKETGTLHWDSPNIDASDSSGFSGLPGGERGFGFSGFGELGKWWTSDEYNTTTAKNYFISNYDAYASPDIDSKILGLSVRCVRDF